MDVPEEDAGGFKFPWPVLLVIPAAGLVAGAVVLIRRRKALAEVDNDPNRDDWGTGAWDNDAWDEEDPEV